MPQHMDSGSNVEYFAGHLSFNPQSGKAGSAKFLINAGLTAHKWGDLLRGMCIGEVRRLLVPPARTFGTWKDKAIYIDIDISKMDDKGFKEYTPEDRSEILTKFYAKYDPTKGADKVAALLEKCAPTPPLKQHTQTFSLSQATDQVPAGSALAQPPLDLPACRAGEDKFAKLCRQLYSKYKAHPVELWNPELTPSVRQQSVEDRMNKEL